MHEVDRWQSGWKSLGVADSDQLRQVHAGLLARYAEPHRHYHTMQHLLECFQRLDEIASLADRPADVARSLMVL